MENEEVKGLNGNEELPLHKVFVDISLENDLKGEELEWFKSRIGPKKVQEEKKKKSDSGHKKVEIVTEYISESIPEKPNKLFLKLSETETIWFLSLDTCFSRGDPEDAERVRQDNEAYKMKKIKKEIIRKRCTADAQTPCFIVKSKDTMTADIVLENSLNFASEWDMYDTYNALDKQELTSSKKYLKFEDPSRGLPLVKVAEIPIEEQVIKTFNSLSFKYASLVTERLLASNCFQSQQSVFKKDYKTRYYTGPTQFTYNAEPLWSFQIEHTLMVTDMDWNPLNEDLLGVGYGDLNFEKGHSGLVCVWSSKNPRQPERLFRFEDSVTSIHYSRIRPNVLAVGTSSGNIFVLDVSAQGGRVRLLERSSICSVNVFSVPNPSVHFPFN